MKVEEVELAGYTSTHQNEYYTNLSDWNFFKKPISNLEPIDGILPYDLNTPLFSDYAQKDRFVKFPSQKAAIYSKNDVMSFPKGTILIKNFFYQNDLRYLNSERKIIETRLLVYEEHGWIPVSYVWNDEQTEALRQISGLSLPVSWTDKNGKIQNISYAVPNQIQCKSCHELKGEIAPIGPTARQLNRKYQKEDINQLKKWEAVGLLSNLPDIDEWPIVPDWENPRSGTLGERARAWLDINCAHCHREHGPAKNTGLYLSYTEKDLYRLGFNKPPVAAGRGSGGLHYDIVAGQPEKSILLYRINSVDPGIMMPEVGRKMIHTEGVALISDWIKSM